MQIVNLYRYEEPHGIVVTPIQRSETDVPHAYRLIADDGKQLAKNGTDLTGCIDTDSAEGWYEVDDPGEPELIDEMI